MGKGNHAALTALLLQLVPADGATIGNQALREAFLAAAREAGHRSGEATFESKKEELIAAGTLAQGNRSEAVCRHLVQDSDIQGTPPPQCLSNGTQTELGHCCPWKIRSGRSAV